MKLELGAEVGTSSTSEWDSRSGVPSYQLHNIGSHHIWGNAITTRELGSMIHNGDNHHHLLEAGRSETWRVG